MQSDAKHVTQSTIHRGDTLRHCSSCGERQHSISPRTLECQGSTPGPAIDKICDAGKFLYVPGSHFLT